MVNPMRSEHLVPWQRLVLNEKKPVPRQGLGCTGWGNMFMHPGRPKCGECTQSITAGFLRACKMALIMVLLKKNAVSALAVLRLSLPAYTLPSLTEMKTR